MTSSPRFTELGSAPPAAGGLRRRWFTAAAMDLIVWQDAGGVVQAFQLCYDKPSRECALNWSSNGWQHLRVDDGSRTELGHKRTPILQQAANARTAELLAALASDDSGLPPDLLAFVLQQLRTYPQPAHE